jgi:hypothetical protein
MSPDFAIFEVLRRHGVAFVVVGGHAVNAHGYRRSTEDIDIVWLRSDDAEKALLKALIEIDAKYIGTDIDPATGIEKTYPVTLSFIRASRLMMLWTRYGFLDLFDYIPGLPSEDPRQLLIDGIEANELRFPSLTWLRRMKRMAGRPKDLLDLENLPE